jgi:hypothetical protein
LAYWIKRPLHRVFKGRFLASHLYCAVCRHHVQVNHFEKQPSHAPQIQKFGRLKPDKRARQKIAQAPSIRMFLPAKKIALPANFDLRNVNGVNYTSPIVDQGPEGSCGSHGYYAARGPAERIAGTFQEENSRRCIYENAKHRGGISEGVYMIDVMEAAVEDGDCRDRYAPYSPNDPNAVGVWPPSNPDALVDAKNWRIKTFADCIKDADGSPAKDPVYNIQAAIYFDGQPIVVQGACDGGTPWTRSWSNAWYVGRMPIPPDNDPLDGGHSYAIIGWKTVNGVIWFIAQNSWGVTNALAGYFEFPAETITCKCWNNYGGAEIYRMVDATSVLCPEGQHYNVDAQQCEDDGSSPTPTPTCDQQLQADALACQKYQNDVFNMFVCIITAYVNWAICTFSKKFKISHTSTYVKAGKKKKKKLTITITEA